MYFSLASTNENKYNFHIYIYSNIAVFFVFITCVHGVVNGQKKFFFIFQLTIVTVVREMITDYNESVDLQL